MEEGVILAFRQEMCIRGLLRISLPFAGAGDRYTVTDEDTGKKTNTDGIMAIHFDAPRTAKLLWISKI